MTQLENGNTRCCTVDFPFMFVGIKSLDDEGNKELTYRQQITFATNLLMLSKLHVKANPIIAQILFEQAEIYFRCNLENLNK